MASSWAAASTLPASCAQVSCGDILAAEFSVEEFLEQLEAEHRIKPEVREQRSMGFVH